MRERWWAALRRLGRRTGQRDGAQGGGQARSRAAPRGAGATIQATSAELHRLTTIAWWRYRHLYLPAKAIDVEQRTRSPDLPDEAGA